MERDALIQACRQYGPSVLRRCAAVVGTGAAEDVAQEVFMTIVQKGCDLRNASELAAWIYRMTTNHCLNWLRTNKRREARERSDGVETWMQIPPADPEGRLVAKQSLAVLLASLDELAQAVFVYRHVDGMTQEEIARVTGRSRRTIAKRLAVISRRFGDEA